MKHDNVQLGTQINLLIILKKRQPLFGRDLDVMFRFQLGLETSNLVCELTHLAGCLCSVIVKTAHGGGVRFLPSH